MDSLLCQRFEDAQTPGKDTHRTFKILAGPLNTILAQNLNFTDDDDWRMKQSTWGVELLTGGT